MRFPAFLLLLCLAALPRPLAAAIPDDTAVEAVTGFVEAYNAGEDAMRAFYGRWMPQTESSASTLEQKLASYARLRQEFGGIDPVDVRAGNGRASVWFENPEGTELVQFVFAFGESEPWTIDGISIELGTSPDDPSFPVPEFAPGPLTADDFTAGVDDWLAALTERDLFAGTVLVAKDGVVVYHRAFGEANRSDRVPNTLATRYKVGSITKDFTLVALGTLLQEGLVSLDDPVSKHLPDYPNPETASRITLHQLVTHTSGLPDIFNERFFTTPKTALREPRDFWPLFADLPLLYEPGEGRRYSNAGYILLGCVIEAVTGKRYADVVAETVFEPAGMEGSAFLDADGIHRNVALGYTAWECPGDALCRTNQFLLGFRGGPSGGSYSTALDLFRFDDALREHRLLAPAWSRWVLTHEPGGSDDPSRIAGETGLAGGAPGVSAAVESGGGYCVVVLANLDEPSAEGVARELARALAKLL